MVQLGGAVSTAGSADSSSISSAFRGADVLLEVSANWEREAHDEDQIAWVKEASRRIHALPGVAGQYLNEADPETAEFAELFWDAETYLKLQKVKAAVDERGVFDCWQCVVGA